MAQLIQTSTRLLGEHEDFGRESYFEGFLSANPTILATSADSPENLPPVFQIGRQEIFALKGERKGITDLTFLIWDPDASQYRIWIYELKVYANAKENVDQIKSYLDAVEAVENAAVKATLVERAISLVGTENYPRDAKIRGALCAQGLTDEVLEYLIETNSSRGASERILGVKVYRFPVDYEVFTLVERLVGEERSVATGRADYHQDIPDWSDEELERELTVYLKRRKATNPTRYEQLRVFLEMLVADPGRTVMKSEIQDEWERHGLPRLDRGLSVSQLFRYRGTGALRQLITYKVHGVDLKDEYRLRGGGSVLERAMKALTNPRLE